MCLLVCVVGTHRAPAVPHVASSSDFLLARLAGGNIALREITGCVTVGQQHPVQQVWTPGSEQAVAYERARVKVRGLECVRGSGTAAGPYAQLTVEDSSSSMLRTCPKALLAAAVADLHLAMVTCWHL